MGSQHRDPLSDSETNGRKRVCKACDRCRLKKSKCDGSSPCNRCQTDNQVCVFGERKKSHDKVYPKGYVEMLEQQQEKLVNATRDLYIRAVKGETWPGAPLQTTTKGYPLTHDILERLGLLKLGPQDEGGFEEDTERLRQNMMRTIKQEENQYPTPTTVQSDFSPAESPIYDLTPNSFDAMPRTPFQPTPPISPEEQGSMMFSGNGLGICTSMGMENTSIRPCSAWIPSASSYDDEVDFLDYHPLPATYTNLDVSQNRSNPTLTQPLYYTDDNSMSDMGLTGY
ncbi:hypothetical protein N7G274_007806 [Stereocaulon virgatum]|uniref:Zn(2)-C6 fungal-type domain-containing protein n=1 Tax=Stereocaulon virgatum TaxID=373712 RepID=A0ABR4A217_9LECA